MPPPSTKPKKKHKKTTPATTQTPPVSTAATPVAVIPTPTTAVANHGSAIPHVALVASMIAGGATVFAALVLAGVLALARSRRGGPRGPEGGHIIIR